LCDIFQSAGNVPSRRQFVWKATPTTSTRDLDGGDFDEWIRCFEDVADLNVWSDGDRLCWLKVRLVN